MTSTDRTMSGNVVVGVDGSALSEHAVRWAAGEAGLQHRGLTLVHVQKNVTATERGWLREAGIPRPQLDEQIRINTERILERAQALAAERCPGAAIETVVGHGDARRQLLDMAPVASMLVVGTLGHGLVAGLLLGSVSTALVRHSEAPVAVVRPSPSGATHGVLIAADGSDASIPVLEQAYWEASQRRLPLTIAHCLWDGLVGRQRWSAVSATDPFGDDARQRVAESIAGMREKFPDVPVEVKIARGAIDAFLVDMSQLFDLLVIGRPPLSLGQRLTLGGLTTSIAEHAHSSVLVVP